MCKYGALHIFFFFFVVVTGFLWFCFIYTKFPNCNSQKRQTFGFMQRYDFARFRVRDKNTGNMCLRALLKECLECWTMKFSKLREVLFEGGVKLECLQRGRNLNFNYMSNCCSNWVNTYSGKKINEGWYLSLYIEKNVS